MTTASTTTASTTTASTTTASEEPSTSGPIARLTDSEPPASVHPEETLQTWLDDVDGEDFFRHAPNTQTQAATNRAGWPAWSLLLLVLVGGGVGMVLARACFG